MLKCQAPVLYLALAPDNSALITSTTDRSLTVRRRDLRHAAGLAAKEASMGGGGTGMGVTGGSRRVRTGTVRYFNRGRSDGARADDVKVGYCTVLYSKYIWFP